jgi:prepilin-type N-terminal cleavage/methylation domain-containing protein
MKARRGGFTLIEMMMVVAIVGILSGLAVGGIRGLVDQGRANGTAGSLARLVANARLRAISMGCRTSVQVNGPSYAPSSGTPVGFPSAPNTVSVFMKKQCDSTNGYFEAGDRIVSSYSLVDQHVNLTIPAVVTTLGSNSVVVSYGMTSTGVGASFQRDTYLDSSGNGSFAVTAPALTADISMNATTVSGSTTRSAIVPAKAPPYLN